MKFIRLERGLLKKEYVLSDAKFIYSKKELGYQEVLDDFKNAAKKKIDVYLSKLKPDSISEKAKVFFNFDNHGKIIMTNNVVYVGSANYSEESENNIEFGIISRDRDYITFLKEEITKELEELSTPYFEYDYLPLILEVKMHLSNLFALKGELFDQVYNYYDDLDGEGYYYNDTEDRLSQVTIDNIIGELDTCSELFGEIYDAAEQITEDMNSLDKLNEYYEDLRTLENTFEDIAGDEDIYELACFDSSERANEILQENYSLVAYDEDLDEYMQKSMDTAHDKLQELCEDAKVILEEMLGNIDGYLNIAKNALEVFEELEFRKVSEEIDNT